MTCDHSSSGLHEWWFDAASSTVRCAACHITGDLEEQDWTDPWPAIDRLQVQGRRR